MIVMLLVGTKPKNVRKIGEIHLDVIELACSVRTEKILARSINLQKKNSTNMFREQVVSCDGVKLTQSSLQDFIYVVPRCPQGKLSRSR